MPFAGLHVLSLESRRAKEMESLIVREGGIPFVAPSVQERALEDQGEVLHWIDRLDSGEFDMLICMTGAGLAFLRDQAAAYNAVDRLRAALHKIAIISRGPKPLPLLRELGAKADVTVPEPNTWKEIVEAVASRPERKIAVQEYGRRNTEMNAALEKLGARVTPIVIYRWELPADQEPLRAAARGLASRKFDVVLFTSSIQLDHLMTVASDMRIEDQVTSSLRESVLIASVGPVMTESLESAGINVDITPLHPKMAALVKAASESAVEAIANKRNAKIAG